MALILFSVVNGKTPAEEHVWLKASQAINLKGYAVVRTFDSKGKVSNEFRHIFVFPDLQIGKDDWVRLYTGTGKYNTNGIKDQPGTIHNLYWESDMCVWNNSGGDTATLISYTVAKSVVVPAAK